MEHIKYNKQNFERGEKFFVINHLKKNNINHKINDKLSIL